MTKFEKIKEFCKNINGILEYDNHGQLIIYTDYYKKDDSEISKEYNPPIANIKLILNLLENYTPYELKDLYDCNSLPKIFGKVLLDIEGNRTEYRDNETTFIYNFKDYNVYIRIDAIYGSLYDYNFHLKPHDFFNDDLKFFEYNPYIPVTPKSHTKIDWEETE